MNLLSLVSDSTTDPLSSNELLGAFGMPFWASWLLIAILLVFSALFSASENAFSNCNKYHFKVLADEGKITPKIIVRLTEKFESTLVSVLVGNNIVQTLISTISAILFYNICNANGWGESIEVVLSTVVVAFAVYIIADTCPKILSKAIPNKMVYILAWPDFIFSIILFPIIILFKGILKLVHKMFKIKDDNMLTKEDFIEKADEAVTDENVNNEEEQLFKPEEMKMFDRAFIFDQIKVEQVLTPKEKIVSFDINDLTNTTLNSLIMSSKFSRFPIYDENKDDIIGILSVNTYFKEYNEDPHLDIRSILLPPIYFSKDAKVNEIFDKLNEEKLHIGLVKDENDKLLGMVTMEDILDELVGETSHLESIYQMKKGVK